MLVWNCPRSLNAWRWVNPPPLVDLSEASLLWQLFVCVCLCVQKNMAGVAENNASTLGLSLDLDYRYQEAEKVLHSCIQTIFSLITHQHFSWYVHIRGYDDFRKCSLGEPVNLWRWKQPERMSRRPNLSKRLLWVCLSFKILNSFIKFFFPVCITTWPAGVSMTQRLKI